MGSGGGESIEGDGWSDSPKDVTDENLKVVHTLVMCNRNRDLRIIASEVGISCVLTDIFGLSDVWAKVWARWVH